MSVLEGWYYLHVNGSLLFKQDMDGYPADFRDSDLVKAFWPLHANNREDAWRLLVEATALGVTPTRIAALAERWGCNDTDAQIYAQRVGCELFMDGDQWCATDRHFINLQESPSGFGTTALEAMAGLANELGLTGGKIWAATFADLLNKRENAQFGVGAWATVDVTLLICPTRPPREPGHPTR